MIEATVAGHGSDQKWVAETTSVPLAIVNGEDDPVINLNYIDELDFKNLWEGEPDPYSRSRAWGVHREKSRSSSTRSCFALQIS